MSSIIYFLQQIQSPQLILHNIDLQFNMLWLQEAILHVTGVTLLLIMILWYLYDMWVKVFKNGPSKICGRQPLKNFTWSNLTHLQHDIYELWIYYYFIRYFPLNVIFISHHFVLVGPPCNNLFCDPTTWELPKSWRRRRCGAGERNFLGTGNGKREQ